MSIKPLADRIVIKVIEDTEQTSGGIFIPDSAKEKPQKGEVVAVGQGKVGENGEREPMDVQVGDIVLYAKYAGTDIKMDGVEYKILSIKDALAVLGSEFFVIASRRSNLVKHSFYGLPRRIKLLAVMLYGNYL